MGSNNKNYFLEKLSKEYLNSINMCQNMDASLSLLRNPPDGANWLCQLRLASRRFLTLASLAVFLYGKIPNLPDPICHVHI